MVELCEPLQSLIDMSAEFYGYSGAREVLTFVTEGEKSPGSMGFSMREDAADLLAAERQDEADQQDPDCLFWFVVDGTAHWTVYWSISSAFEAIDV